MGQGWWPLGTWGHLGASSADAEGCHAACEAASLGGCGGVMGVVNCEGVICVVHCEGVVV